MTVTKKTLLLQSQRNDVFNALKKRSHDMGSFRWDESLLARSALGDDPSYVSVLFHPQTGFYFEFDMRSEMLWCRFSPGQDKTADFRGAQAWQEVLHWVNVWSQLLTREFNAPDPWAELAKDKALSNAAATSDNVPLTETEVSKIDAALSAIEQKLLSIATLDEDHKQHIRQELQYLKDASTRLGKKDWLSIAVGIVFTIAFSVGQTEARDFVTFAGQRILDALGMLAQRLLGS